MRIKGTLVEWNDERGFGFLEPAGGGQRAFCHISAFGSRSRRPMPGDRVTYELAKDERGRLRAVQIRSIAASTPVAAKPNRSRPASPWIAMIGALLFLAITTALVFIGRLPWIAPLVYLIMSALTIFAYAFDKSAAMNGRWRTKEDTLHLFSLLCGWPGAWISQSLFRHKTKKTSFIVTFAGCVLINVGVLTWIVLEPHSAISKVLWAL
jgi:uncharacterized membrane protein YsdA (DUF1294 family)/cold shock CspA family protein